MDNPSTVSPITPSAYPALHISKLRKHSRRVLTVNEPASTPLRLATFFGPGNYTGVVLNLTHSENYSQSDIKKKGQIRKPDPSPYPPGSLLVFLRPVHLSHRPPRGEPGEGYWHRGREPRNDVVPFAPPRTVCEDHPMKNSSSEGLSEPCFAPAPLKRWRWMTFSMIQ